MIVFISGQSSEQKIARVENIAELNGTLGLRGFNPSIPISAGSCPPLEKQPSSINIGFP